MLFYAWVAFAASLILSVVVAAVMSGRKGSDSQSAADPAYDGEPYDPDAPLEQDSLGEGGFEEAPLDDSPQEFASEEVSEFAEFEEDFK